MVDNNDWEEGIPEGIKRFCEYQLEQDDIFTTYRKVGTWKGYGVIHFESDEEICIGTPCFIIYDDEKFRFASSQEAQEIMRDME